MGAEVLTSTQTASILTFRLPGVSYADIQNYLWSEHRLRLRGIYEGDLDALRASIHLYNTPEEVDRAIEAVSTARDALCT